MRSTALFLWRHTLLRYAFSGASAAAIDVGLLYACTHYLGIYYLVSAVIAASVSFVMRFLLQKFFAFRNRSLRAAPKQFLFYSLLYLCTVSATVALLYVLVEWVHLWYVAAQIIVILMLAAASFFVYKYIIFPADPAPLP